MFPWTPRSSHPGSPPLQEVKCTLLPTRLSCHRRAGPLEPKSKGSVCHTAPIPPHPVHQPETAYRIHQHPVPWPLTHLSQGRLPGGSRAGTWQQASKSQGELSHSLTLYFQDPGRTLSSSTYHMCSFPQVQGCWKIPEGVPNRSTKFPREEFPRVRVWGDTWVGQ